MARVCIACKRVIPDTESSWRDHAKRYCCQRCYQPKQAEAKAVNKDGEQA